VENECWLCDGTIREREGANVPSLGSIAVHRRCLEADLSSSDSAEGPEPAAAELLD
jgi:hypothetical protein